MEDPGGPRDPSRTLFIIAFVRNFFNIQII